VPSMMFIAFFRYLSGVGLGVGSGAWMIAERPPGLGLTWYGLCGSGKIGCTVRQAGELFKANQADQWQSAPFVKSIQRPEFL
jgi:hypothetical protein